MVFIVTDQQFQEETTSKVSQIMMFSRLMSERSQSDTRRFAPIPLSGVANLFAAKPVRTQIGQQFAINSGNAGSRSEESSYPLRS
jgi:hypothetical protein